MLHLLKVFYNHKHSRDTPRVKRAGEEDLREIYGGTPEMGLLEDSNQ